MILLLAAILISLPGFSQGDINVQMVYVKGGNFFRGCDDPRYSDAEYDNEKPVHRVNITSFSIGKYEITQGQWRTIMGILPMSYQGVDYSNKDCDNCPVVKVTWEDVLDLCATESLEFL